MALGPAMRVLTILAALSLPHGVRGFSAVPVVAAHCARRPAACRSVRLALRAATVTFEGASSEATHATDLRERGFAVLSEPVMEAALVERALSQAQARLVELLLDVEAAGFDPLEQQCSFQEIASRHRLRWDLQLQAPGQDKSGSSTWSQLCQAALAAAKPVISGAQGAAYSGAEPIMVGAVISRPGAPVQRFHCDADTEHLAAAKVDPGHRLYNLFIPLVDIDENGDGTEFWGSPQLEGSPEALAHHFISESGEQKAASLVADQIVSPRCQAGGLIIYDYRTIHRGSLSLSLSPTLSLSLSLSLSLFPPKVTPPPIQRRSSCCRDYRTTSARSGHLVCRALVPQLAGCGGEPHAAATPGPQAAAKVRARAGRSRERCWFCETCDTISTIATVVIVLAAIAVIVAWCSAGWH